jgi:hypothetical protein
MKVNDMVTSTVRTATNPLVDVACLAHCDIVGAACVLQLTLFLEKMDKDGVQYKRILVTDVSLRERAHP